MLLCLTLSACNSVSGTSESNFCKIDRKIGYDDEDTIETKRLIIEHDFTWDCLCSEDPPEECNE